MINLEAIRRKEEEKRTQELAEKLQLPYVNLLSVPIQVEALALVQEKEAKAAEMAVFQKLGKNIGVATKNPQNPNLKKILNNLEKKRFKIKLFFVSPTSLNLAWKKYSQLVLPSKKITGEMEISPEKLSQFQKEISNFIELKEKFKEFIAKKTTEILEILLASSLKLDASDVHIEPEEEKIKIRLRIDGMLQEVSFIPPRVYHLLLSRIKLLSGLKLNIHQRAQDGRFSIVLEKIEIEIRTSVLPSEYGETIVLRILNPKMLKSVKELGLKEDLEKTIIREISRPNGIILNTGPTGSGKTTTLYACLFQIKKPEIKIITIEDPIEYHLEGISQTQVNPQKGYDFSNGLRSILRQDPDVILVGEIRDRETAEIAFHAALTGHLVFSSLHTNDAAGTVARLVDMGVNPEIIAPALNLAIAQRLVRKVCSHCAKSYSPSSEETKKIKKGLSLLPPSLKRPSLKNLKILKAQRCKKCNLTGYKGRIGIFEFFLVDKEMEKFILKAPSIPELKETAIKRGMITMQQDGILKVLEGTTTLEEVERVTGFIQ